jgi:putative solute:sodium symporter small subunit
MENNQNDYHVSFFKPVTEKARRNRNMTLWLISIWAIGVFGFQILLRVIEEPVPEDAYIKYEQVWDNVKAGSANMDEHAVFAKSVLQVLGKVYVKPDYKPALQNAFTHSLFIVADDNSEQLASLLQNFENQLDVSESIIDPEYLEAKKTLEEYIAEMLDLKADDTRNIVTAFSLKSDMKEIFSDENMQLTEKAMGLYLIHNRSVLTDTKFLGFPFHYFYTAVFLLILFVGICWTYCFVTDKREAKSKLL